MEIKHFLAQFDLTGKKAYVYLAILELGSGTVIEIAKKAEVKRTTVYDILLDLEKTGLIYQTTKESKRLFVAEDPEKLKKKLEEKERMLDEMLPQLRSFYNLKGIKPKIKFLDIKSNAQPSFELYNPVRLEFEHPVLEFDSSFVKFEIEVDSLFQPVPFKFERDSINPRNFTLRPSWKPAGKYKISIDSAAVTSIYGLWNNKYEQSFAVKDLDEYGNLQLTISGLPEGKHAFVELLNNTDKPFRKSSVKGNIVKFQDLPPGELYARLIIDDNEDGKWTTGSYEELRQPEKVYYYNGKFVIRAFSDHLEDWDILAQPVTKQKPLEITKNKPQEKKRRNPNEELERQQQQQSRPGSQQQNRQGSQMQSRPGMQTQGLGGGMSGMR